MDTPPHYMNQNMKFLICVRSNEDVINERQKKREKNLKNTKKVDQKIFFLTRERDFSLFYYASSHCQERIMIYRINFHTLHAPLRFRFAFSYGLFFFFLFFKKYPRPSTWNSSIRQYRIGSLVADTGLSSNSANVDRPRPQCPPT